MENNPEDPAVTVCSRIPWSLVKQEGRKITISQIKCKCWDCEICGPRRSKQLQHTARLGLPKRFITLTASPESGNTPDLQAQALRSAWRTVRRRAKKRFCQTKIEFLAVYEKTKHGRPHLHILCRSKYIPQKWLSDQMKSLTNSPIVDIRRVKNKKMAARYISKYLAKAPERFEGCKRYWRSMDYCHKKQAPSHNEKGMPIIYYMLRAKPEKVVKGLQEKGFSESALAQNTTVLWLEQKPPPIKPGHIAEWQFEPKEGKYL